MTQYNNFCGFETQGAEEAGVSGSAAFNTTAPLTGRCDIIANATAEQVSLPWVAENVTDAGTKHYVSLRMSWADAPPSATQATIQIIDASATTILGVQMNTSGNLILIDANGSTLDTSAGTYHDGSAHTIEIYADLNSASGAWEWWIDETSEGSGTGADLTNGNSFGAATSTLRASGVGSAIDVHIDDMVIMSGLTATTDRPARPGEVFAYQTGTTGVAPTVALTGISSANVDIGTWDRIGDTPANQLAREIAYTGGAQSGAVDTNHSTRGGPSGDSNIDGDSNIVAQKLVAIVYRGTGSAANHYIGIGDSGDTTVPKTLITITTTSSTGEVHEVLTTNVPTSSEDSAHGIGKEAGGRDINCIDAWSMILHIPASSGTTISMALASFTLSGQTVTITRNVPFTANAGSFTLTGQTLDFTFSTAIAMALATFSLSGQDPTITRQLLFNADAGTVTFTGRTADLLRALVLDAAQGSFTLSGLDPTLSRNVPFLSDTGSFTLSGLDVDLLRALLVNMDTGAATLTGQELTLLVTTPVLMALASFALSGLDVGITRQIVVDMALAAMAFTGRDNTITRQIPVAMDAGGFTLGGQDATFTLSVVVNMDAGGFTLSGQDLTFIRDLIVAMATGTATVSGLDANLLRAIPVNMDLGAFTLAGQDPTLLRQIPVTMDLGSYTFNGQTVTINVSGEINMELGTFTLSGMSADFITAGGSGGTSLIPIIRRRRR